MIEYHTICPQCIVDKEVAHVLGVIFAGDDGIGTTNATKRMHVRTSNFGLGTPGLPAFLSTRPVASHLSSSCGIQVSTTIGDHHAVRAAGARVPQPRQSQERPHGRLPPPLRADAPSRIRSEAPPGQREQPPRAATHPQASGSWMMGGVRERAIEVPLVLW